MQRCTKWRDLRTSEFVMSIILRYYSWQNIIWWYKEAERLKIDALEWWGSARSAMFQARGALTRFDTSPQAPAPHWIMTISKWKSHGPESLRIV